MPAPFEVPARRAHPCSGVCAALRLDALSPHIQPGHAIKRLRHAWCAQRRQRHAHAGRRAGLVPGRLLLHGTGRPARALCRGCRGAGRRNEPAQARCVHRSRGGAGAGPPRLLADDAAGAGVRRGVLPRARALGGSARGALGRRRWHAGDHLGQPRGARGAGRGARREAGRGGGRSLRAEKTASCAHGRREEWALAGRRRAAALPWSRRGRGGRAR
jgi:hypothetical protein